MFQSRQDANTTKRLQEFVGYVIAPNRCVHGVQRCLLFTVATMNRNTPFDPMNTGNTPTNDLANDFAMDSLGP